MKTARIVAGGPLGHGTKVLIPQDDGSEVELPSVTGIDISIRCDSILSATVEVLAEVDMSGVLLLLGEETLRQSAEALGYDLVPRNG